MLTADQIRAFYRALSAYRGYPETALCLRLIAFTACRPGEAPMRSGASETPRGSLAAGSKMKARRDHVRRSPSQS